MQHYFLFFSLFSYYIYVNTEILLYLRPHWKIILCPLLLMMMLILAHSNGSITCISFTNNVNTLVLQTKKECNVASILGFPRSDWLLQANIRSKEFWCFISRSVVTDSRIVCTELSLLMSICNFQFFSFYFTRLLNILNLLGHFRSTGAESSCITICSYWFFCSRNSCLYRVSESKFTLFHVILLLTVESISIYQSACIIPSSVCQWKEQAF